MRVLARTTYIWLAVWAASGCLAQEGLEGVQSITDRDLREAREMLPPPDLDLPPQAFALDLNDNPRRLWESAGKLLGLEVLFDGDYPESGQALRFRVDEQSARQILHGLSAATASFVVPLGARKIMVVKDTAQKRQEREPTVSVILTLPDPLTLQELQESARAVQQVMEIQKFAIDNRRRMILMRDRLSKVRPAQQLFEQLLGARPAVLVEVELFEMRTTGLTEAGIRLPTSTRLFWLGHLLNNTPPETDNASVLATFGGGASLIGMTLADATVTATALRGFGTSVQRAFVQSVSGLPGQLLLGERYPILTAGYFGEVPSGETVFRPPPSFQFQDLGLTLKVTPYVHGEDEMTLDVDAEFKLLSGAEINGLPILANRKFTSRVRMRNGQWAIVSGLRQEARTVNTSGIPGLMQLPILGPLLRSNTIESDDSSALLLLKPRLLGVPPGSMAPEGIFLGPEGRPAMPL